MEPAWYVLCLVQISHASSVTWELPMAAVLAPSCWTLDSNVAENDDEPEAPARCQNGDVS